MKIYISGPITGHADLNEPAFREAEEKIKAAGHEAVVPHDVSPYKEGKEWRDYMRDCIPELCKCDAALFLDYWVMSRGACFEAKVCDWLEIPYSMNIDNLSTGGSNA